MSEDHPRPPDEVPPEIDALIYAARSAIRRRNHLAAIRLLEQAIASIRVLEKVQKGSENG